MTVAAVTTESVAVIDSEMEQGAVWLVEVASATEAASLIEAGNTVFADGVSVLVLLSATSTKKTKMEAVSSVAVTVSATSGVNMAVDWVESVTEAVSAVLTAKLAAAESESVAVLVSLVAV